jgi:quinol monooxygenase YgiN
LYRVQGKKRLDDPQQFLFYERYENDKALADHAGTPHFKESFTAIKPILDGKAEIVMYKEI